MEEFLTHFTYWGVILVLLASGVGLPIPEDIPLITAGYLSARGYASIEIMIPLTFIMVVGADFLLYLMGRKYGRHVPKLPLFRRFLTPKRLAAAEMAFHTHGGKTLFTSRFVPGVRAAVFFTAGVFKIPAWKMLLFDGGAALISVPVLVLAGYFFADHIDAVKEAAFATQVSVGILIAIAIGGYVFYKWRKHKTRVELDKQQAAAEAADDTSDASAMTKPAATAADKPIAGSILKPTPKAQP